MRRIRLTVAYDGTNYCGWQIQPNGITIEEVLNKAICKLTGEEIQVIGASRTDSGVHARGNIAVFDTESRIPAERFSYALNQRLPKDIVVVKSDEVDLNWHPRYQDTLKTYEYHIINTKVPIPTERLYNYFVSKPEELPSDMLLIAEKESVGRAVCDYISGMTDRYAIYTFRELFIPEAWNFDKEAH